MHLVDDVLSRLLLQIVAGITRRVRADLALRLLLPESIMRNVFSSMKRNVPTKGGVAMGAFKPPGNLYLAHALLRFIGTSGAGCSFASHTHYAPAEWELCALQDLDRGAFLLSQGMDEEQADQQLWEDACKEQDSFGTRFYQKFYCCNACALKALIGHANDQRVARSMMASAQTGNMALLLVSERSTRLPLIVANISLNIRAVDIWPLLQSPLTIR
jgi:hypothetical protein